MAEPAEQQPEAATETEGQQFVNNKARPLFVIYFSVPLRVAAETDERDDQEKLTPEKLQDDEEPMTIFEKVLHQIPWFRKGEWAMIHAGLVKNMAYYRVGDLPSAEAVMANFALEILVRENAMKG